MLNIWAVGRNYQEHIKEMGYNPNAPKAEPLIFLKAGSSQVKNNGKIHLPSWSKEVHHEVEIALRFDANLNFDAYTIALDLTARDVQAKLKEKGQPWTLAKSFSDSCPMGDWKSEGLQDIERFEFSLFVNDELKQKGYCKDMIFKLPELRNYILQRFPVRPGDALLTGTPEGVGPLQKNDQIRAEIKDRLTASWNC